MDKVQLRGWPSWWHNPLSWPLSMQMHHKQSVSIYQAALTRVGITSPKGEQESRRRTMGGCSHDASRILQVLHTLQSRPAGGSHCAGLGFRCYTRAYHTRGRRRVQVPRASNCCRCGTGAGPGLRVLHTMQTGVCGWDTRCGYGGRRYPPIGFGTSASKCTASSPPAQVAPPGLGERWASRTMHGCSHRAGQCLRVLHALQSSAAGEHTMQA